MIVTYEFVRTLIMVTTQQMGDLYYLYVVWNAKNPDARPIIIPNPVKNLSIEPKETVTYYVNQDDIRKNIQ